MEIKNTPENITQLKKNEVIVIGTNFFGINGAGAAKLAQEKFGLKPNVPIGLCGQSYGIVTKDLKGKVDKKELSFFIEKQVILLYLFANVRKDLYFYVTKIGCGLGGYTIKEIKSIFEKCKEFKPENIILPIEFE